MRGFQAKPDLLGLSVVASCVCLSGMCGPPLAVSWGLYWKKNSPLFLCDSHTQNASDTRSMGFPHIKQSSATSLVWGGGGEGGPMIQLQQ